MISWCPPRKSRGRMGGLQLQEPTASPAMPPVKAALLLTFTCAAFVLFLICGPALRTNISSGANFGIYWASGAAAARGDNPYAQYPETAVSPFRMRGGEMRDVVDR